MYFTKIASLVLDATSVKRLNTCTCSVISTVVNTLPTFNSCSKCMCSPGIIHDHTPDCLQVSWSCMHGRPHNPT